MKADDGKLHESEWDFRAVIHKRPTIDQKHELRATICYEYARESSAIRKLADRYAALPEADRFAVDEQCFVGAHPSIPRDVYYFSSIPFWNCILWANVFPQTPWLLIPADERSRRVQSHVKRREKVFFQINERNDLRKHEFHNWRYSGTVENIILQVDWAAGGNGDIIGAFERWVRDSRPKDIPPPRDDATRENVTAALLTRLSVMRLLHHYSHWKAQPLAEGHGLKMPRQQSNALKMRGKVREDIHRIFQSELFEKTVGTPLVPRTEFPRHWNTLTERRGGRFR